MTEEEIRGAVDQSLRKLAEVDRYLFDKSISERCLTARLALHLQGYVPRTWFVDVEYNRSGLRRDPKSLDFSRWGLSEACANPKALPNKRAVIPDLVVHRRGPAGPNLLVVEAKKTTNGIGQECDTARVRAFLVAHEYKFGAVIEFQTRKNEEPGTRITWISNREA